MWGGVQGGGRPGGIRGHPATECRKHAVLVPRAAVTNHHILGGLKQQELIFSQVLEARSPPHPLQRQRREPVPCLLQLLVAAGFPWLVATSLPSASISRHLLLRVFVVKCSSGSLSRTHVMAFSIHLDNPGKHLFLRALTLCSERILLAAV